MDGSDSGAWPLGRWGGHRSCLLAARDRDLGLGGRSHEVILYLYVSASLWLVLPPAG
jgi:hypothetical protein